MNNVNWNEFKVRCSAIQKVMSNSRANPTLTEKQSEKLKELEGKDILTEKQKLELSDLLIKKENGSKIILSDTCIEYLMEEYAWRVWGKLAVTKEFDFAQIEKGKMAEEDSITLLSRVDKVLYVKNTERVYNDFLSGEPDVSNAENIMQATEILDIKTVWDAPIFLKKINNGADNGYDPQVKGYCDITGASRGWIAYCLVDTPEIIRMDFKRRLFYKGNYVTEESPDFLEQWSKIEKSMVFGDIPIHQRVHKIPVERFTNFERQKVYDRVKVCRDWLNVFHEKYQYIW